MECVLATTEYTHLIKDSNAVKEIEKQERCLTPTRRISSRSTWLDIKCTPSAAISHSNQPSCHLLHNPTAPFLSHAHRIYDTQLLFHNLQYAIECDWTTLEMCRLGLLFWSTPEEKAFHVQKTSTKLGFLWFKTAALKTWIRQARSSWSGGTLHQRTGMTIMHVLLAHALLSCG